MCYNLDGYTEFRHTGYMIMDKRVILISIDGMRPDGMQSCGNSYVKELERLCTYSYGAKAVMPSVTFPCHYSMAHSVTPDRHGILTNTYLPEVRPVKGLFERIKECGGASAMYYTWEELRDLARPGSLKYSTYIHVCAKESSDTVITDEAIRSVKENKPDFAFLYMGETDEKGGHAKGWMSERYLEIVGIAIENVKRVIEELGDEYSVIIMADHGGHGRSHGSDCVEDMTIPLFFYGPDFEGGRIVEGLSLLDIAPTVTAVMGIAPDGEWEGHSII